jgi:alkylation response protein AidB-like acyl-CoA dehydrogenase
MTSERLALTPGADAEGVRRATREWIEVSVPPPWLAAALAGDLARLHQIRSPEAYRDWYPSLGRAGLTAPSWPLEYGGLGLSPALAGVVGEELRQARLTVLNPVGITLAAAAILEWGDDGQKLRYLPRIATNEDVWCQLFSEPGAGSDLAGLATRAERAGNDWLVSGQKVWSSFAHEADRGLLLTRSDPDLPKHRGITAFALDMHLPGVTVRPLRKITGDREFNEVFLDSVPISDADRLGPPGSGWRVTQTALNSERLMLAGTGSSVRERTSGRSAERVVELALAAGPDGIRPIDDPAVRQRLAQLWAESRVVQWGNQLARDVRSAGIGAGPEGSIRKLIHSEHNQRLQMFAAELLGRRAIGFEPGDAEAEAVIFGFLRSRGDTIAGGSSEIQRNIIGERVLGLPREPGDDRDLPWREIPRGPKR